MSALPVPRSGSQFPKLAELEREAVDYAARSRAASTIKAYRSDWRAFTAWCDRHGLVSLPAEPVTVALYLTDAVRTLHTSTLRRRLSSIAMAHQAAGEANPCDDERVKTTWSGIRRTRGTSQHGKDPVLVADLRVMIHALPDSLAGCRDACLLLLGFAAALRRSELVALSVEDLTETPEGLIVKVRQSKTDQEGSGREIGVPHGTNPSTCPVRALRAWRESSRIASGPLFRSIDRHGRLGESALSGRAVALIVKRASDAAGLDPTRFAGHSLRSGMATSAARAGAREAEIMSQTGHKSLTVLRRYIRRGSLFNENAASKLGL